MGSEPFMAMVATYATRKTFIDDAIIYLRRRNFDGLDIDWEYPANRGSPPGDKPRYTALIRVSFDKPSYIVLSDRDLHVDLMVLNTFRNI